MKSKVLLENSQGSVPKKLPDIKISTPPTSQTLKTNQTNALEMQEKYLDSVEVSTSANVSSS
ncbi:3593_t:CDS:1, partial [Funneliformis mosseae]